MTEQPEPATDDLWAQLQAIAATVQDKTKLTMGLAVISQSGGHCRVAIHDYDVFYGTIEEATGDTLHEALVNLLAECRKQGL